MGKLQQGVNDLYTWCKNNGEFGQQLINEWTGLDENNQPIYISNVTKACHKKVKWRCSEGHEWIAAIGRRTDSRTSCPYCSGKVISEKNSLKNWCLNNGVWGRQLLMEWTGIDENNQPISIDNIVKGSAKKVKWRCSKGHEWFAIINSRTANRNGCPYCDKQSRKGKPRGQISLLQWCLANGDFGRQLMNEWIYRTADNKPSGMDSVSYGSSTEVTWRCKSGHIWKTTITSRTSSRKSCPYCTGRLVHNGNALQEWCINNGEWGQQLLNEWAGLDENNQPISIDNVTKMTNKKVKWKCNKGHEWYASILSRTRQRGGCPYCSGKKVSDKNSLKTWSLNNGKWGQQLLREWTGLDENNQPISVDSVSYGSMKKVKWKCSKGHEWLTPISRRTIMKTGCPCCFKDVPEEDSFQSWCINNGSFGKQLINEWEGLDENNQTISMNSVSYGSGKKVKWKCNKGHEWFATIASRTIIRASCPCCYRTATEENNLKAWCINNGEYGKQILNEWTGIDENNQSISIDSVARASRKKVKWRCSKGHEWFAIINNRTANRTGCPYCAGRRK